MSRKGLNKETVINAAICLIEQKGHGFFSMRELAETLGVKTASLYNHIESMDALLTGVGLYAITQMTQCELDAVAGKQQDEALFALANAYRGFARKHTELYQVIMGLQKTSNPILGTAAGQIIKPIMQVLATYGLDETAQMHWQRILRSIMHGFFAHENAGCFSHYAVQQDISYHMAIQCFADGIRAAEKATYENR